MELSKYGSPETFFKLTLSCFSSPPPYRPPSPPNTRTHCHPRICPMRVQCTPVYTTPSTACDDGVLRAHCGVHVGVVQASSHIACCFAKNVRLDKLFCSEGRPPPCVHVLQTQQITTDRSTDISGASSPPMPGFNKPEVPPVSTKHAHDGVGPDYAIKYSVGSSCDGTGRQVHRESMWEVLEERTSSYSVCISSLMEGRTGDSIFCAPH